MSLSMHWIIFDPFKINVVINVPLFSLCGHCNQYSSQDYLVEVVQHIDAYPLH